MSDFGALLKLATSNPLYKTSNLFFLQKRGLNKILSTVSKEFVISKRINSKSVRPGLYYDETHHLSDVTCMPLSECVRWAVVVKEGHLVLRTHFHQANCC